MGLFGKKKEVNLYSPINGKCISLKNVKDEIFSSKMMGDGVAFAEFSSDEFCAPCDGKIMLIADTLHAFGMKATNGAEILVHIGLDTVMLNGEGFTKLANEGENVKKGTPIIKLNLELLNGKEIDLTTSMVVTNGHTFEIENNLDEVKAGETKIISFK